MKVLLINASDRKGGAARAAYRLHKGLQKIDVESQMVVQEKQSDDSTVLGASSESGIGKAKAGLRLTLEKLPLKLYADRSNTSYSPQWLPDNLISRVTRLDSDLINLHWIGEGYLQIETIAKFDRPIVWTLHDMWAFTGGCHYNEDCDRFMASCGACPQLGSKRDYDLSRWVWRRKAKAWQNLNPIIVALSSWHKECVSSSSLFKDLRVEVIPNGLDITKYRPIERQTAREILGLPQDKQIVAFGAIQATSDRRKGFHLLQAALQKLSMSECKNQIELLVFGASQPANPPSLGFKTRYLGYLNDDLSLALMYSAADVTVVPSIQETFGQTASESLACGTPVVAFNATGLKDIIDREQNGYLARPYETEDLAKGIVWVLNDRERYQKLSYNARKKAEREFALEVQARRYLSLYTEILEKNKSAN